MSVTLALVAILAAAILFTAMMLAVGSWRFPIPTGRRPPADWLERVTLERVVIHTTDDRSISGLVAETTSAGVLLRSPRLLGREVVDMAGEVWVPRDHVAFAQSLPEDAKQAPSRTLAP